MTEKRTQSQKHVLQNSKSKSTSNKKKCFFTLFALHTIKSKQSSQSSQQNSRILKRNRPTKEHSMHLNVLTKRQTTNKLKQKRISNPWVSLTFVNKERKQGKCNRFEHVSKWKKQHHLPLVAYTGKLCWYLKGSVIINHSQDSIQTK